MGLVDKIRAYNADKRKRYEEGREEAVEWLCAAGFIDATPKETREKLADSAYLTKHFAAHLAGSLSANLFLVPGITDIAGAVARESWSISSLAYELMKGNYKEASIHASVIPFCWIPPFGPLSYLFILAGNDPDAALVEIYGLSKTTTGKSPQELMEYLGEKQGVKTVTTVYRATGAHYAAGFLGRVLSYCIVPQGRLRENVTAPVHKYLIEKSSVYRTLDEKFQNIKYVLSVIPDMAGMQPENHSYASSRNATVTSTVQVS